LAPAEGLASATIQYYSTSLLAGSRSTLAIMEVATLCDTKLAPVHQILEIVVVPLAKIQNHLEPVKSRFAFALNFVAAVLADFVIVGLLGFLEDDRFFSLILTGSYHRRMFYVGEHSINELTQSLENTASCLK
jgi:hypothetical protein